MDIDEFVPGAEGETLTNAKRLSPRQERRLVEYIEEKQLAISGQYKKRSHPTSTLPTLSSYLTETRSLLSLIMLIPPLGTAASLRVSLLLRFTGEALDSIPGYSLNTPNQSTQETTEQLLEYLDALDKAWLAVLQSQLWDSEHADGVDLIISAGDDERSAYNNTPLQVTQTDRTRLRSLLILGTEKLEEWLPRLEDGGIIADLDLDLDATVDGRVNAMAERNRFNDLFNRTLNEMGELS